MADWTAERIAQLKSADEVERLRDNATRLGNKAVVDLCEADLLRRKPPRIKKPDGERESRAGHYVSEFHFVCPNELGVTRHANGLVRSGTWVVAEAIVKRALSYGSIVALHASKAEPSYLQGVIKTWEKQAREPRYNQEQLVQTEFGIDFLFEPTGVSLPWVGEGSGEKGYAWAPIPKT